jgi:hypothetical protein
VGRALESGGDEVTLPDGLYRVTTSYLCAGFVVAGGKVTACAPILRRKLAYWMTVAVRVGP